MPYLTLNYGHWSFWEEFDPPQFFGDTKVAFDGQKRLIVIAEGITSLDVREDIYEAWKEWVMNPVYGGARFPEAISVVGGDPITDRLFVGSTFFLENGWRIQPWDGRYILDIVGNIYTRETGENPINPVAGVTISLTRSNIVDGVNTITDSDIQAMASAVWNSLRSEYNVEGSFGQGITSVRGDVLGNLGGSIGDITNIQTAITNAQDTLQGGTENLQTIFDRIGTVITDLSSIATDLWTTSTMVLGVSGDVLSASGDIVEHLDKIDLDVVSVTSELATDDLTTADQKLDSLIAKVDDLDNDIANIPTTDLSGLETKIDTIDTVVDRIEVDTIAIETKVDTAITDIGNIPTTDLSGIEAKIDTIDTVVDRIEVDTISIEDKIDNLNINVDLSTVEAKLDIIDTVVDRIEVDTISIEGKVDTAITDIGNIPTTDLSGLETKIDTIDTVVDSIKVDTVSIEGKVDTLSFNTGGTAIQDALDKIDSDVVSITAELSTDDLTTADQKLDSLLNSMGNVETKVVDIDTVVDRIEVDTTSIESKVDSLTVDVSNITFDSTGLENKIDVIDNIVDSIQVDTNSIENKVDTITTGINDKYIRAYLKNQNDANVAAAYYNLSNRGNGIYRYVDSNLKVPEGTTEMYAVFEIYDDDQYLILNTDFIIEFDRWIIRDDAECQGGGSPVVTSSFDVHLVGIAENETELVGNLEEESPLIGFLEEDESLTSSLSGSESISGNLSNGDLLGSELE